jgi:RNA polymerase sigma-70 factor (ECF subfamily)
MAEPVIPIADRGIEPERLEQFRQELTAYCYRMLGSAFEAEDAVQETMLRAVRAGHLFEGRSRPRSWLYRIATNACVDMLRGRSRRAFPVGLGAPSPPAHSALGPALPERTWVTPVPDALIMSEECDPAEITATRESVRLAFVTALQCLPARQRVALILCQVLRFQAAEVATILDATVPAVNSALSRARATLATLHADERPADVRAEHADLLARYMDAFERYDIHALVGLLREDAIQSMPPYAMWLRGSADIAAWMTGAGRACRGSRVLPTAANGCPAFGQYHADPLGGHSPFGLHLLEVADGHVSAVHTFLDTGRIFPLFALPAHLPER